MPRRGSSKQEDLDFIIDTYQNGMSPFNTPPEESRARRMMLKGIAKKRAPRSIPLLNQIETIVKQCEKGEITLTNALNKMAKLSSKHGDKNLHKGILMKIDMIKGTQPKGRVQKPIALFSLTKDVKKPRKKRKKKSWDPLKDEHPMAKLFGGK